MKWTFRNAAAKAGRPRKAGGGEALIVRLLDRRQAVFRAKGIVWCRHTRINEKQVNRPYNNRIYLDLKFVARP